LKVDVLGVVIVTLDGRYDSLVIRCAQIVVLHWRFTKTANVSLKGTHHLLLKNTLSIYPQMLVLHQRA